MKRRWYRFAMLGVLAFMLCSCGGNSSAPKDEIVPGETVEALSTEASEESTEAPKVPHVVTETVSAEEENMETVKYEVSEYFDDWDSFYEDYHLDRYKDSDSGMIEYKSQDGLRMTSLSLFAEDDFTLSNTGNKDLLLFGIKIGDNVDSIVSRWKQEHSMVVRGESSEGCWIYLQYEVNNEKRTCIASFGFSEGVITAWSVCNFYEEGDTLDINCLEYLGSLDADTPELHYFDEGLIFPNIQNEILSISDIQKLSKEDMQWAINDIYALNGYKFTKDRTIAHYGQFAWYSGREDSMDRVTGYLNDYEKKNLENLQAAMSSNQSGSSQNGGGSNNSGGHNGTKADLYNQYKEEVAKVVEKAEELEYYYQYEAMSQSDLNKASGAIYKLWEEELNQLYGYLKEQLSESEMDNLREEEREWVKTKEKEVDMEGSAYAGGSMRPMVENDTAARLTKDRVFVLLSYLENALLH